MDKRIIICIVVILGFAFLALIAGQYLEIYPRKRQIRPSSEVRSDSFYAFEKWLNETSHLVRNATYLNNKDEPDENVVMVFAEALRWKYESDFILSWIEDGNSLVLFVNKYHYEEDENLKEFINHFGITAETTRIYQDTNKYTDDMPYFDMTIQFLVDEDINAFTIKDDEGFIKLAQIPFGEGNLTVTGYPYFMLNNNLKMETNALLTWELTAARTTAENPGVLFIRVNYNQPQPSVFGKIMERGNLIPVIISAFLLIVLGFWNVIPVFGPVFREKQKYSRSIKERFSAEIKFLKKYKALDYYLKTYERELGIENLADKEINYNYGVLINKIRSVYDGTEKLKRRIGSF